MGCLGKSGRPVRGFGVGARSRFCPGSRSRQYSVHFLRNGGAADSTSSQRRHSRARAASETVPSFDLAAYVQMKLESDEIVEYDGMSIEALKEMFDIEPWITIQEGPHGYPYVLLRHDNGSSATVALQGAAITSWMDGSTELLYSPQDNDFHPARPIEGGIHVAFPQYHNGVGSPRDGKVPQNGFTRHLHWELLATSISPELVQRMGGELYPTVSLNLHSSWLTRTMFPHDFEVIYHVTLLDSDELPYQQPGAAYDLRMPEPKFQQERGINLWQTRKARAAAAAAAAEYDDEDAAGSGTSSGDDDDDTLPPPSEEATKPLSAQLGLVVEVANTGAEPFEFQAAVLADLLVKDLSRHAQSVRLLGMTGRYVIDYSRRDPVVLRDDMEFTYPLTEPGTRMHRVFTESDDTDNLFCPGDLTHFELVLRSGFKDTVLAHVDVEQDEDAWHYVTLGAGKIGAPVVLEPGRVWIGDLQVRRHPYYWIKPDFEEDGTPLPDTFQDQVTFGSGRLGHLQPANKGAETDRGV